jgi:GntR family transcriptional regulator
VNLAALDRRSVTPLYYQILHRLREQIRTGSLKAGHRVPSEQEISARLRVSRMTARQALKSLCSLGLTYSQRGKGTFVSRIKMEKNSRRVLSFSKEMETRGSRTRSKVLKFELASASEEVADALHLAPNEKVIRLKRVRIADSLPMAVECACLPSRLCPDLLHTFDPGASLYKALSERYGIQIASANEVAEAGLASAEVAQLLRIAKRSPVFLFTRTSYIESGQPVEYVKSTYRGDRYKITSQLTHQDEATSVGRI